MGGGLSRQSEHKRAKLAAAEHQRLEVKAPSRDDIDDSSDDEDPETRAARLRRIDKARLKKRQEKAMKKLSELRLKTMEEEDQACEELKNMIRSRIRMRQLTTQHLSTLFGKDLYGKCRYKLPNRSHDYDHIEIKDISLSRTNDFRAPYPVNASVTYDWQNPVQSSRGTAMEKFEVHRIHGLWKIKDI